MARKNLTTEEMVGLSGEWVRPGATRALLEAHPRTAGNVADIGKVHEGILAAEPATVVSPELAKLVATEKTVDFLFDRKARGSSLLLVALAELTDSPEQAQAFLEAQALIAPEGLGFINANYAAEAGTAALTRRRLSASAAVQATLASLELPLDGKPTLADAVATFLDAGDQLGQLEAQRQRLAPPETPGAPSDRQTRNHARNRWIRVINALVDQIHLDDEVSPELQAAVLRPLAEAEARADARAVAQAAATAARAAARAASKAASPTPGPAAPAPAGG